MSGAELLPSCKLLSPHGTAPPPPASVASPLASARLVGVVHRLAPTTGTGNGAGFMAYLPSCLYQEVESPGVTPGARPVPVPVPPPTLPSWRCRFAGSCRVWPRCLEAAEYKAAKPSGTCFFRDVFCLWATSGRLGFVTSRSKQDPPQTQELQIPGHQLRVWKLAPAVQFQA